MGLQMLCSFCSKSEPVRIEIRSLDLRICPNCLATFLPAAQFPALRRDVDKATKGAWIRRLNVALQAAPGESLNSAPVNCLEHGEPLESGTIPNYSFEGLVPKCCDLQHLPPSLMAKILELGLDAPSVAGRGASRAKINPVSSFLGGIVFYFWEKKQKKIEDGLDRLQYSFKFKDVLGEWIPE